jgi:hypothetical protein
MKAIYQQTSQMTSSISTISHSTNMALARPDCVWSVPPLRIRKPGAVPVIYSIFRVALGAPRPVVPRKYDKVERGIDIPSLMIEWTSVVISRRFQCHILGIGKYWLSLMRWWFCQLRTDLDVSWMATGCAISFGKVVHAWRINAIPKWRYSPYGRGINILSVTSYKYLTT